MIGCLYLESPVPCFQMDLRTPAVALTSRAIPSLFKAGKINLARKLFDEMPNKDIVAFSSMIYGYATNGLFTDSLRLLSRMTKYGIQPNSFTIVASLLSSSGMHDLKLGESIHGRTVKSGLDSNPFVRTAMLDSYAKCGSISSSHGLFKEMVEPSLVTCSAMISGLVRNGLFEEAILIFKKFWAFGLVPNRVTMMSVTQSCVGYGSFSLCESLHGYIMKTGFDSDVAVMNSVFDMYLSFGNLEVARQFFRKMVVLDVISWTSMMGFLLVVEQAAEALEMFVKMGANGIEPDFVAMINVIMACALLGDLRKGRSVHSHVLTRAFDLQLVVVNSLIAMYAKCGDLETARMLFDQIVDKSLVSWTAMISGYLQNGQPREGLELLIRMRRGETCSLDSVTLVSSIGSCSELANLKLCEEFHAYSFRSGLIQFSQVQNSLVAAYGKCGRVELALGVFKEMVRRDIVAWNAMISSYGINGKGEEAVTLFQEMEKCSEEPDTITYLNVLTACSHSGLVNDGLAIFERMVWEERIAPRGEHCGCVVDMLARAGRLADARELVNNMWKEVDANVWKALLGGCRINGDVDLAEVVAERVFTTSSEDPSHAVSLSNIYASAGRFESVEALRSRIGEKGLFKNLGFSMLDALPCDGG